MSLEHGLLDVFLVHHGSAHRTAERLLRGSQWLMTDLPGGFSLRHSLFVVSEQKCVSLVKSALRSQGKTSHRRTTPCTTLYGASQVALVVKNPPANAGDIRDAVSIPGSGRSLGIGSGNPLQYSCLENPMDRGALWAIVYEVKKSQT